MTVIVLSGLMNTIMEKNDEEKSSYVGLRSELGLVGAWQETHMNGHLGVAI